MMFPIALALTLAGAPNVPDLYQRSYEQEVLHDAPGALATLDQLPQGEKATYLYALRRGWLLYLGARYGEAVEEYRRAVGLAPQAVEPRLGLSLSEMAARRWLDAEKTLLELQKLDPGGFLVNSRLAFTWYNLGRFKEAEVAYRKVLGLYPSDVEMQAGLGWALLKQGRAADAKPVFQRVLTVAPRHASAQAGLSECNAPAAPR
ncbi:MAG: tetratricopeptide repeat protein [Myxococcales bacterium]|nr:tetratricopeptide repeat protein [Myxococcales bacterium]